MRPDAVCHVSHPGARRFHGSIRGVEIRIRAVPDPAATELYGLPLSEFIPERDRRVKALRADKKRDEAKKIAALRKPSVAAWAVNQLVRTQGKAIKRLFTAGDAIATAQSAGKADALRKASGDQRDAIDELLQAAEGLLNSDGHPLGAATLERVRETLRAASIDSGSRAQVADGCLTQELQFAGLGIGDMTAAFAPAPVESAPKASSGRAREAQAAAERERKAALTAARKAETEARRRADRAEKTLKAARSEHEQAEAALKAAEASLAAAAETAEQAAAELTQAERAVRELDGAS